MGGEPTFVSVDDMTSAAVDGGRRRPREARNWPTTWPCRWSSDFATGGLIQRSQGKWYPGEPLPRWQIALIWRTDGSRCGPIRSLLADPHDADRRPRTQAAARAEALGRTLTADFGLPAEQLRPATRTR